MKPLRTLSVLIMALLLVPLPARAELGGGSTYGSGGYGTWVTDADGLPAYELLLTGTRFVTNGDSPPQHMLGNKQTTAFVHPDGYVQLFTNRTFPRFANYFAADKKAYAGGFGYVQQATRRFSTAGPDLPAGSTLKTILGMGYVQRTIVSGDLKIVQRLYLASADESVIDEVTITNLGSAAQTLNYLPYWDSNSTVSTGIGLFSDTSNVVGAYDAQRRAIKLSSQAPRGNFAVSSKTTDPSPKVSYFVALSHALDSYETLQSGFFGLGTRANPAEAMIRLPLPNRLPTAAAKINSAESLLVGRFTLTLAAGQSTTVYSAFGITEVGNENAVIDRLRGSYATARASLAQQLLQEIPRLNIPQERWIERELAWNYYHLRAGLLQEDFWQPGGLKILNQGSVYLYQLGGNMALRDPLQHILPLMSIQPALAKDTLIFLLKTMQSDGKIPYGTTGYGAPDATLLNLQPSDLALWLLWSASEYVFATRDFAFLQQPVTSPLNGSTATVAALLKRAYQYQVSQIGYGSHGLIRLQDSDWNDVLVKGSGNKSATIANGESTVNTAIATFVYKRYQQLIATTDPAFAAKVGVERNKVLNALRTQWKGNYFNRAYVALGSSSQMNEVGNEALWLEANAFAMLSDDTINPAQTEALINQLKVRLSDRSPAGMANVSAEVHPQLRAETTQANWNSITGPAIQGLLKRSETNPRALDLAWTEFKKNSLATHAETFRNIWYGVWSGPDMYYNEVHRGMIPAPFVPGMSWMDGRNLITQYMRFPTANMHAHAPMLQSAVRFSGIEPTAEGFTIDPKFPFADFSWITPVQSVQYGPSRTTGSLVVTNQSSLFLTIALPVNLRTKSTVSVSVNQVVATVPVSGRTIRINVTPNSAKRVSWIIQ